MKTLINLQGTVRTTPKSWLAIGPFLTQPDHNWTVRSRGRAFVTGGDGGNNFAPPPSPVAICTPKCPCPKCPQRRQCGLPPSPHLLLLPCPGQYSVSIGEDSPLSLTGHGPNTMYCLKTFTITNEGNNRVGDSCLGHAPRQLRARGFSRISFVAQDPPRFEELFRVGGFLSITGRSFSCSSFTFSSAAVNYILECVCAHSIYQKLRQKEVSGCSPHSAGITTYQSQPHSFLVRELRTK